MKSTDRYFLTHIPKTASTSIRKAVFDRIVEKEDVHRYSGVRAALRHQGGFRLLRGHYPYGVHWLYQVSNPKYFVMMRNPVDRAVSHYYFVEACDSNSYQHPRLDDVKSRSLSGLYEMPEYQNMQTRFIAGLPWQLIGRKMRLNNIFGKYVLWRAKKNLTDRYEAFGLKERFKQSVRLFASRTGANPVMPKQKHKKTKDRPSVSDLEDEIIVAIKKNNALDIALYKFALAQFDSQ